VRSKRTQNRRHPNPTEKPVKFYGIQQCLAIFRERPRDIQRVFIQPHLLERFQVVKSWCGERGITLKVVEADELTRVAATEHHEGVCFEAKALRILPLHALMDSVSQQRNACLVVLEGVENPHNVGAIIRTACFFGVAGVVLISSQISNLSGAACRVSEGGAEVVPISIVREPRLVVNALRAKRFTLFATTPHRASSVYEVAWTEKTALLFGAEGTGLTQELLEASLERVVIPKRGPLESLNVGAAVAVLLAEAIGPRRKA
jgi:TrmH RNA methyltransferase